MNHERAWALIELRYDYLALGRAALVRDVEECRFRISVIVKRAHKHGWETITAACIPIAEILDSGEAGHFSGLGVAYAQLGNTIASIPARAP